MAITYHAGRRIQGLSANPNTSLTPSVESDYTNSSWSTQVNTSGTYWQIANNSQEFQGRLVNSGSGSNYDLGTSFQNINQWTLRFEITVDSNKEVQFNGDCVTMFGIQSGTTMAGTSGGSGGSYSSSRAQAQFQIATANSTRKFQGQFETGTSVGQDNSHFTMTYSNDTKYYIELKKTGSTSYTLSAGTNSDYATGRTSSNITGVSLSGLRYLHMETWNQNSSYESRNGGKIENLKIWTDNPKPTDVQVGSRFEETDTRKMYHYGSPSVTWEHDYSNSTGWTEVGSTTNITGGVWTSNGAGNNADHGFYKALGFTLDDEKWYCEFDIKQSGSGDLVESGNPLYFSAGTAKPLDTSHDALGIKATNAGSVEVWKNTAGTQANSPTTALTVDTQYYGVLIRTSATNLRLKYYTNSARTTQHGSTVDLTLSSGITGLNTIQHRTTDNGNTSSGTSNIIDNVKIYNGVSSLDNVWSEIGT